MAISAIRSVKEQKVPVSEIILVDDGSMDGTAEAVRCAHPDVHIIRTGGVGPGEARNLGVRASKSATVMFLDSDDRWLPDHTEALLSLVAADFDVAYGVTLTVDSIAGRRFLIPEEGRGVHGACLDALLRWCFLVPSSVCVTRKAFEEAGGFGPQPIGEDWAFFLRLASRFPFGFTDKIITERLLHDKSLSYVCANSTAIADILSVIKNIVRESAPPGSEAHAWIERSEQFAREKAHTWRTIQDWYMALKASGMLDAPL